MTPRPGTRDPRNSPAYRAARAEYRDELEGTVVRCCLCHELIDLRLPYTAPRGLTIEHRLPIRVIIATTETWAEAVELAADPTYFAPAHRRCQSAQGGRVAAATRLGKPEPQNPLPSRDW